MAVRDIGSRLREVREYLNISQQQVAQRTGIPRPSVSAMEHGKRRVEVGELEKLAALYGYPVSYFMGNESSEEAADPRARALFRAAKELSETDLDEVVRFAEYLKFRDKRGAGG